jgi:hypothetical protein
MPGPKRARIASNVSFRGVSVAVTGAQCFQFVAQSHWASLGVTRADGSALASDPMPAALLVPMGRKGPAFLAYPNFAVYLEWNRSLIRAAKTRAEIGPVQAAGPVPSQARSRAPAP